MNNILDVSTLNKSCTGCSFCSTVCPVNAISIAKDQNGFFKPSVNNELCVNCGLCKSGCYKFLTREVSNKIKGYYYVSSNDQLLSHCSSGGASEEIMISLIQNGYTIIGCSYSDSVCHHKIAEDIESLEQFRGSKYMQSNLQNALLFIKNNPGKKIAFFGTPCQGFAVANLIDFYKYNRNNYFIVTLMCYGVPSQTHWNLYIQYLEKKYKSKLLSVGFRDKYYGWHIPCLKLVFEKYVLFSRSPGNPFLDLYYSKALFNDSCYSCDVRCLFSFEDIRLGDFWGNMFSLNKTGVSCVITCTKQGEEIIHILKEKAECKSVDVAEILKWQACTKTDDSNPKFNIIKNAIISDGFKKGYSLYRRQFLSFPARIKTTLKKPFSSHKELKRD